MYVEADEGDSLCEVGEDGAERGVERFALDMAGWSSRTTSGGRRRRW